MEVKALFKRIGVEPLVIELDQLGKVAFFYLRLFDRNHHKYLLGLVLCYCHIKFAYCFFCEMKLYT